MPILLSAPGVVVQRQIFRLVATVTKPDGTPAVGEKVLFMFKKAGKEAIRLGHQTTGITDERGVADIRWSFPFRGGTWDIVASALGEESEPARLTVLPIWAVVLMGAGGVVGVTVGVLFATGRIKV